MILLTLLWIKHGNSLHIFFLLKMSVLNVLNYSSFWNKGIIYCIVSAWNTTCFCFSLHLSLLFVSSSYVCFASFLKSKDTPSHAPVYLLKLYSLFLVSIHTVALHVIIVNKTSKTHWVKSWFAMKATGIIPKSSVSQDANVHEEICLKHLSFCNLLTQPKSLPFKQPRHE